MEHMTSLEKAVFYGSMADPRARVFLRTALRNFTSALQRAQANANPHWLNRDEFFEPRHTRERNSVTDNANALMAQFEELLEATRNGTFHAGMANEWAADAGSFLAVFDVDIARFEQENNVFRDRAWERAVIRNEFDAAPQGGEHGGG